MKLSPMHRTVGSRRRMALLGSGFFLFGSVFGNCSDRGIALLENGFHSGDVYAVVGQGFEALTQYAIDTLLAPLKPPANNDGGGIPTPTL